MEEPKKEDAVGNRKEKVKIWLKDPYNLAFLGIMAFAVVIRLYYFSLTMQQPLWWDEAEYMATAKHWAFGVPYEVNAQRPPLFQLLAVPLLKIGLTETALKFLLVLIPSLLVVLITYLLGKEMFNKKIALIAAFTSSFIWSFLFWSLRFQPDFISLSFQMLSILFFWKVFKENKKKHAIYAGIFAALGFYFKISALLVPLPVFLFVLFKDGISFIKNKNYWISFASFIITMLPFAIWQYVLFGNPAAFAPSYIGGTGIGQGWEFGWMVLNYFYQFPKAIFFFLFLLGAGLALLNIILSFDIMIKNKEKRLNANIFSLMILIVLSIFYIFYIRGTIEDRWVFLMAPFIMYFSAAGLVYISEKVAQFNKKAYLIIVLLLLSVFVYYQMQHADSLIKIKKESYLQVKESSIWIKQNSDFSDKILSNSYTQATVYTEREIIPYPALKQVATNTFEPLKKEELNASISEKRPRYIVVSVFERHPDWTQEWINENTNRLRPVQVYFADQQQTQVALVIYELVYL